MTAVESRNHMTVRLDAFEGPLDLLLYLIQKHEMDISKISISKITNQYLATVRLMQNLNFDLASEFLVMAATLLLWKSRAVLAEDEPEAEQIHEEDALTPEQLVEQLIEHQRFLEAGQELSQYPILEEDVFVRPNSKPPVHKIWREMNVTDLALGYQDILTRARKRRKILKKETVSMSEKLSSMRARLRLNELVDFTALSDIPGDWEETVVTFLACLELSRLRHLKLYQQEIYDPIYIELIKSLEDFDLKMAIGFDAVAPAPTSG